MASRRKFRPRTRSSGSRGLSRLIIIATEGTRTEKKYFEDMAFQYYHNPRVHVEVLERLTSASSPKHVLDMLNDFKRRYSLKKDDELWMVIDLDRWHNRELGSIAAQCKQKGYRLAVSNPCFELWLLLHIKSLDDYTDVELQELVENKRVSEKRTRLERELLDKLGSYNKSNPDTSKFLPFVDIAIERARALDPHPEHRWPNSLGTRVYLLAETIIAQ